MRKLFLPEERRNHFPGVKVRADGADREKVEVVCQPINNPVICLQFLHLEERELGSPYTGPEALKKGPLFIKKVTTNQDPRAPPQGEGPPDLPRPPDPASEIKQAAKNTTSATITATKPMLEETGPEPKGKDSAPTGKKSLATIYLAVPGPHSPGPIKSPRPMKCPASPFAWPPKGLAPSMSSLNSLASSCFDLTDISLNTEYAPLCLIFSKMTCMKNTSLDGTVDMNLLCYASPGFSQNRFIRQHGGLKRTQDVGRESTCACAHKSAGALATYQLENSVGLGLLRFLTAKTCLEF